MSDKNDEKPEMTEKGAPQQPDGLALLMLPFEKHEIGKLPKPTKAQTEEVKADFKAGVRCNICSGWHHPKVVHLDYVGHAALTKRLLQVDPRWSWEPMALTPQGAPLIDQHGGLWIRLTVCGMTRIGYGHADGKSGGDALKEAVGDALRNSALRFGAALGLWHKGDLYDADELKVMGAETSPPPPPPPAHSPPPPPQSAADKFADKVLAEINACANMAEIDAVCETNAKGMVRLKDVPGTRWIEISNAIAARGDELRFPADDREPGSDG